MRTLVVLFLISIYSLLRLPFVRSFYTNAVLRQARDVNLGVGYFSLILKIMNTKHIMVFIITV